MSRANGDNRHGLGGSDGGQESSSTPTYTTTSRGGCRFPSDRFVGPTALTKQEYDALVAA